MIIISILLAAAIYPPTVGSVGPAAVQIKKVEWLVTADKFEFDTEMSGPPVSQMVSSHITVEFGREWYRSKETSDTETRIINSSGNTFTVETIRAGERATIETGTMPPEGSAAMDTFRGLLRDSLGTVRTSVHVERVSGFACKKITVTSKVGSQSYDSEVWYPEDEQLERALGSLRYMRWIREGEDRRLVAGRIYVNIKKESASLK